MVELLIEILTLFICAIPGGGIRWIIFRKKSFEEYIKDDLYVNAFAVGITVAAVVIVINIL